MYTNVIGTAFDGVTRVPDCVTLLEIFYMLAKRDAIKRCVEKKTADVSLGARIIGSVSMNTLTTPSSHCFLGILHVH